MNQEHEIVLYQIEDTNICVNVIFKDETFWMTQKALAELFDVNVPAISKHLSNIFEDGELIKELTVSKMEIVQKEGNRNVKREQEFYNLDAIIAVGYRVNSKKATRFRQWATKTLREYITKGFVLNDDMLKNGKPMQDWVDQTNQFLMNNRRKVLEGKGRVSHDEAIEKANKEYKVFRVKQDQEYVSEFDREVEKYLKGEK
ncbi:MAG: RhuM family protein [Clostridiales bacterium]|nr:RhuM family protein [Clostridiales bacterium]